MPRRGLVLIESSCRDSAVRSTGKHLLYCTKERPPETAVVSMSESLLALSHIIWQNLGLPASRVQPKSPIPCCRRSRWYRRLPNRPVDF